MDLQQHIETALANYIEKYAASSPIYEAICYSVLGGGKRIRPILVYTIAGAYGVAHHKLDQAACALELIHCYSLIHDDLPAMDNDDMRRGKPSCHIKFGEATAILAGDAIQALAFQILAEPQHHFKAEVQLAMLSCLTEAAGARGIIAGQIRDIAAEGKQLQQAALEQIHREKTASLFQAAVTMGALAAPEQPNLNHLGELLGLAFQLQDDLLEHSSTSTKLGKPANSDQKNQKATHAGIIGIAAATQILTDAYNGAKNIIKTELPKTDAMLAILDTLAARTN